MPKRCPVDVPETGKGFHFWKFPKKSRSKRKWGFGYLLGYGAPTLNDCPGFHILKKCPDNALEIYPLVSKKTGVLRRHKCLYYKFRQIGDLDNFPVFKIELIDQLTIVRVYPGYYAGPVVFQ